MKKYFTNTSFITIMAFFTLIVFLPAFIEAGQETKVQETIELRLREGFSEEYIRAADRFFKLNAIGEGSELGTHYIVKIEATVDKAKNYLMLFNNLPGIASINRKPVEQQIRKAKDSEKTEEKKMTTPSLTNESAKTSKPNYVSGEILVKFNKKAYKDIHLDMETIFGIKILDHNKSLGFYRVSIPENHRENIYIKMLSLSPYVAYAEYDLIMTTFD